MSRSRLLPLALLLGCSPRALSSDAPAPTSTAAAAPASDIYLARLDLTTTPAGLDGLRNLTDREGYDNQPHFADEREALLYTSIRDGQADIYVYELATDSFALVHGDPANEYSPTIMPHGRGISMIREAGGVQKLWHYSLSGEDLGPVLDVVDVGYHAWLSDDDLALFILDTEHERHRLEIVNIPDGTRRVVASNIGRCLAVVPRASVASGAITFVILDDDAQRPSTLMRYDHDTGAITELLKTRPGSQDYAWAPDGSLLMAQGAVIHRWTDDGGWQVLADLGDEGLGEITRLAVSGDGAWLALVGAPG